jgi:hypothetical protein
MNTANLLEREYIEAWLAQQPDDRTWNFDDPNRCVLSTFLKEFRGCRFPSAGQVAVYPEGVGCGFSIIPQWLRQVFRPYEEQLGKGFYNKITARDLKAALGLTESQEPTPTTDEPHAQTKKEQAAL